ADSGRGPGGQGRPVLCCLCTTAVVPGTVRATRCGPQVVGRWAVHGPGRPAHAPRSSASATRPWWSSTSRPSPRCRIGANCGWYPCPHRLDRELVDLLPEVLLRPPPATG